MGPASNPFCSELRSHMCTFLSLSSFTFVDPLRNHASSSTIPLKKTFLEVSSGNPSLRSHSSDVPNTDLTFPFLVGN